MDSPAGSEALDAQAERMREEMHSPSEHGASPRWESPQRGEFGGSQSPAFSEPLSSPASVTHQSTSYLLNAEEIVISFFGVAKNDQYLTPVGVGVVRGPNKSAEFIFSYTFPLELFKKVVDLEDVAVAALKARLGLDRKDLVGTHARSCTLSGNTASFFGNSAMVPLDRPVHIGPAATRMAQQGLTLYLRAGVLFKARVAAALDIYVNQFKQGAASKLGYNLTDSAVQSLTGHSAGTVKAALGIGKEPTRDCVTLSKLEKVMMKHLDNNFSTIAVDLETGRMKKSGHGSCGAKRVGAVRISDDDDDENGEENEAVRKKGRASRYTYSSSTSKFITGHAGAYRSLAPSSRVRLATKILQDLRGTPELSEHLNEGLTEAMITSKLANNLKVENRAARTAARATAGGAEEGEAVAG